VTFAAKDYCNDKKIEVTLEGVEFIRRFLIHVLPKGFVKIRNFGIQNTFISLFLSHPAMVYLSWEYIFRRKNTGLYTRT
jgi:hypothetical protein